MGEDSGSRDVLVDGKVIGSVDASLAEEEQIQALRMLMLEKGYAHEVDEVEAIFRQALSFARTSSHLHQKGLLKVPHDFFCVAPFVVNSALSIELYLKTLSLISTGKQLKGHRLTDLYDELPGEAKQAIELEVSAAANSRGLREDTNFYEALSHLNNAFIEWRYLHEKKNTKKIEIEPTIFVMKALHGACVRVRKE